MVVGLNDTTYLDPTPPSPGDVFTFYSTQPFTGEDVLRFSTYGPSSTAITGDVLDEIRVVPNPYVAIPRHSLNSSVDEFPDEVRFTHLPPECTIDIYTLNGDHVRQLRHDNPTYGELRWDLLTTYQLRISFGIYLYVVKTPEGDTKVGKMAVVK